MNAMIYIRGHRSDYDHWEKLGNPGWDYASVLPYFKKAQHQERGESEYHGVGGPLNVADLRTTNPLSQAFIDAGVEAGFKRNEDFNGAVQEGVGYNQVTQKLGRRCSAACAYLKSALGRPNLTVHTGALVRRVVFEGNRAAGVEFQTNGCTEIAKTNREVILSGGAINSPQILLLSGIGPTDHLKKLGIPVVAELPGVGQNLQDHPVVAVAYRCKRPVTLDHAETLTNLLRYVLFKRGPLTSNIAEAGGFVRTRTDLTAPDLQLHFAPVFFIEHGFTKPEGCGFTLGPTLLQPESRGSVALRSRQPTDPPVIHLRLLESEQDMQTLIAGVKLARQLLGRSPFDQYRGEEGYPGRHAQSDDQIAEYIRSTAEALYHPVGTCKMGNDSMAVVDSRLQVHQVEGLRVVDASIMPRITRGNTNAPTIMIAEKAAEMMQNN
jgi:choline dehydrogenase